MPLAAPNTRTHAVAAPPSSTTTPKSANACHPRRMGRNPSPPTIRRSGPATIRPGIWAAPAKPAIAAAALVVLNLSANDYPSVLLEPTTDAGSYDGDYVELFTGDHVHLAAGQSLPRAPWEYRVYVQGPDQSR